MAFTAYATTAEFKAWVHLNDTVDDAVLVMIGDSVTEWIDEYADRHFWKDGATGSEVARTFEACSRYALRIDDLVPGTITALKTDETGDGTFETTWAATDYDLLRDHWSTSRPFVRVEAIAGRLFPIRTWPNSGRAQRVQITGIWGWASVPRIVKMACLEQMNREFKRAGSPEGVAGFGDLGAIRLSGRLDPDVERNLGPLRRHAVLAA